MAYQPKPNARVDTLFFVVCALIAAAIVVILGVALFASLASFRPYNLTPTLKNYDFNNMDGGDWASFFNSLQMAGAAAVLGTALIFLGAYLNKKSRGLLRGID